MKPVLTPKEANDLMRDAGDDTSLETFKRGLRQGKYPGGLYIIVHKIPRLVQRLVIGAGAGGLGLAVGTALPPLLGLTAWRPGLTLAGLVLLAVGCAVEVMTE